MAKHMTIRMAWHDNNWNGKVCKEPEKNVYCVGTHSLLSERLARNRNLEIESKNPEANIDKLGEYLPPCYWTSNAFSDQTLNITHAHPFSNLADKKIKDTLLGYSVFTWPFRLSFNHDERKRKTQGSYPAYLEERVTQFIEKFKEKESIVFFYLNYDNPISADENKYVLVGCATLTQILKAKQFEFGNDELKKLRRPLSMRNFPTMNWAISVSYDFQKSGIILPYQRYLEYIEQNPDESNFLDEMKIVIEEEDMQTNFKYVCTDIDDDSCIYLLTRLKKSLSVVKEHGIVSPSEVKKQIETIDKLLERSWEGRGLYPSLGRIFDVIAELDSESYGKGNEIIQQIQHKLNEGDDLLEKSFELISEKSKPIPAYLKEFESTLKEIKVNLPQHNGKLLRKLSLFSFTQDQIKNILSQKKREFQTRY